jgi:hypothetical protein
LLHATLRRTPIHVFRTLSDHELDAHSSVIQAIILGQFLILRQPSRRLGCVVREAIPKESVMKDVTAPAVSTRRASEALISLLGQITSARHQNVRIDFPAPQPPVDLMARITVFGRSHTLACAFLNESLEAALRTLSLAARTLDETVRPVLIAAELDATAQALCRQQNVDFVDLAGNARLELAEIFSATKSVEGVPAELLATQPAGLTDAAA